MKVVDAVDILLVEADALLHKIDMNRCYQLGANSYIVKPANSKSFLRTVSDVALYWLQLNHPSF